MTCMYPVIIINVQKNKKIITPSKSRFQSRERNYKFPGPGILLWVTCIIKCYLLEALSCVWSQVAHTQLWKFKCDTLWWGIVSHNSFQIMMQFSSCNLSWASLLKYSTSVRVWVSSGHANMCRFASTHWFPFALIWMNSYSVQIALHIIKSKQTFYQICMT